MQRLFMALVLAVMFAVAGLIAAPLFIDIDSYKNKLLETVKLSTGLDAKINGDAKITFFPSPKITVHNISIENKAKGTSNVAIIKVDSIDVRSSFYSIFSGSIDIKDITLIHPVIEIERLADGTTNWQTLQKDLESSALKQNIDFPDNISIKNGTIAYNEKQKRVAIDYISANVESASAIGPFYMQGNFSSDAIVVKFDGTIGKLEEGSRSYFNLSSDSLTLRMDGIYDTTKGGSIYGDIEGKTTNLSAVTELLFDNSGVFSSVKSKEELSLEGKFNISSKIARFRQVTIKSGSINGKADVDALFSPNAGGPLQWDMNVLFSNINIDKLTELPTAEKKSKTGVIDYYASSLSEQGIANYNFDISRNLSAQVDFTIDNMTYNKQEIKNLKIDADIFSGKAAIHKFGADLPGNSSVELTGNIEHNGTRPLLRGQINASGEKFREVVNWIFPNSEFIPENKMKEFSFTSNIKMTPHKINLSDLYASFDESLITGNVLIRPKSTIPVITANISIDRLDMDSYGFTYFIQNKVKTFGKNITNQNLATSWLKTLNMKYDVNIDSRDIRFNGFDLKSASTSFVLQQGIFKIQKFLVSSKDISLNAVSLINLNTANPTIEIVAKSNNFDTSIIRQKSVVEAANDNEKWTWSTKPFDLMGIDRFNGNFKLSFRNLKHDNLLARNLVINATLAKKVLSFSKFNGKLYGGKFDINGSVGVDQLNPSMGISIALSNVDIKGLMSNIYNSDYEDINGTLYLSGIVRTFGKNPNKWINELELEGKIAAKSVIINSFDLDNIILKSRKLYSVIDMDEIVKKSIESGSTKFDSINGKINAGRGIMQVRDLNLRNKFSRGILAGNMSLKTFETKSIAKISFWPERGKKVTLKVNFDGAIDNLKRQIDTADLEQYITDKGGK